MEVGRVVEKFRFYESFAEWPSLLPIVATGNDRGRLWWFLELLLVDVKSKSMTLTFSFSIFDISTFLGLLPFGCIWLRLIEPPWMAIRGCA